MRNTPSFDMEGAIFLDLFSSVCFHFNKLPEEICVVTKFQVAFYPFDYWRE